MVDFCNPEALGTPAEFRRLYERPILASREPDASDAQVALGAERNAELSSIVNEFILRRTNALLSAHLPPKARRGWALGARGRWNFQVLVSRLGKT